jgi:hypothetical protein
MSAAFDTITWSVAQKRSWVIGRSLQIAGDDYNSMNFSSKTTGDKIKSNKETHLGAPGANYATCGAHPGRAVA